MKAKNLCIVAGTILVIWWIYDLCTAPNILEQNFDPVYLAMGLYFIGKGLYIGDSLTLLKQLTRKSSK